MFDVRRAFWVLACVGLLLLQPAHSNAWSAADGEAEITAKREKLSTDYVKGMLDLAQQARKDGLDADTLRLTGRILRAQANHADALALVKEIKENPSTRPDAKTVAKVRKQVATSRQQLTQKTLEALLNLTNQCDRQQLKTEKVKCAEAGLLIDLNHKNLHLAAGHKQHPEFGWVDAEADAKLRAGQRRWKGEWKLWKDIQKERQKEFADKMTPKLGPGFTYLVTPHMNFASNLQDPIFGKQLIDDTEALIRDQYRAFYGPLPLDLQPFDCIVFDRQAQFQEYARKNSGNQNSMGYFGAGERCLYAWYVANPNEGFTHNGIGTPFHELTHGLFHDFMDGKKRAIPIWLDEGFASFFEMARTRNGVFAFGPLNVKRMHHLRDALAQRRPFDLEGLLELNSPQRFHDKDDILNYNRAAMLMHFLYEKGKLPEFLAEYKVNPDGAEVLCQVLGTDLKTIDQQITLFAIQKLR